MTLRQILPLLLPLLLVSLSGCALFEGEAKPRPGVREAKACYSMLQKNPQAIPGYFIESCSNRGAWVVEQIDEQGLLLAKYDFVNLSYAGQETGGGFIEITALGEDRMVAFRQLEAQINQALLQLDRS
ncbi:MAG: hypothetical protein JNN09_02975 [Alphaproteobacteria bacterium]|nr:hypothetical protein [Alphaproteobacteria bacterium]